jgi:hypothetical protein
MEFDPTARIGVERTEAEPENLRRLIVALEKGRAAAASEEAVDAGAGLPAGEEMLPRNHFELASLDAGRGAEARP